MEHTLLKVSKLERLLSVFGQVKNFPILSLRGILSLRRRMTRKTKVFIRYGGGVRTVITLAILRGLGVSSVTILSQITREEIENPPFSRNIGFKLLSFFGCLTSQVILADTEQFIAYPFILPSRYYRSVLPRERCVRLISRPRVLIVAKYQPRKRIIEACDILSEFSKKYDFEVTLILQCLKSKRFSRKAKLLKNSDRFYKFKILWNVNPERMVSIYKSNDLFLDFARKEPASISPVEANSLGLSVITSRHNGVYELLANQPACYFHDESKISLLLCLRRALR